MNRSDMTTHWSRHFPRHLLGLVAVAVVAAAGCSGKTVKKLTVHGTIVYKGQLLRSGMLKFVGTEGAYSAAQIKSDGTFIITDVVPGEVTIAVVETPQGSRPGSTGEPKSPPVALPDKFRDPATSGVKYTITPDTTELDIELK